MSAYRDTFSAAGEAPASPCMGGRPELTYAIPADPRVASLPQGEVYIGRRDGRMWIERADPRVVIGAQLLDCIAAGPSGGVTLTFDDGAIREPGKHYEGAVLRIEAANRTLVYRITQWLPWYLGCIAEWPD
jgi:hypothetical protein